MKLFVFLFPLSLFAQDSLRHFESMPSRWTIEAQSEKWNPRGNWYDPYNQNKLKGDYPILGENTFLIISAASASEVDASRVPTPSGVSTSAPQSNNFFGQGERFAARQNLNLRLEFYHGQTAFRPRDWEIRVNANLNLNYLTTRENNNVNINPNALYDRLDQRFSLQDAFIEKRIINLSPRFDFASIRAGIQSFSSDFRRFIFADQNLALRVFGNYSNNFWQYNLATFRQIEKDTNSGLNSFTDRRQRLFVANVYRQDWPATGYTSQLSFHYNYDSGGGIYFDDNGFPIRPALIGVNRLHTIRSYYIGTTGEGHIGRWNATHAFYQALGTDTFNQLAGVPTNINAQMAALELSYDVDWKRYRASVFYASGDATPNDATASGFDSIIDAPLFAGGFNSFWNTQAIRLLGVNLVNAASLLPNLRPSKFEGQSNFVNPGIFIASAGIEIEATPKVRTFFNTSYLQFITTASLQKFLNQATIRNHIGIDSGLGFEYRPFLNNQAAIRFAASTLFPMRGFVDIYQSRQILFATSLRLILAY